jgi:hypothetical protein
MVKRDNLAAISGRKNGIISAIQGEVTGGRERASGEKRIIAPASNWPIS